MNAVRLALLCLLTLPVLADDDVARIKEQELEEVRQRISDLKKSMDRAAEDRDRLSADLERAEVDIAAKRRRLAELEAERLASEQRRRALDLAIDENETVLEREAAALGDQLRTAYMSGTQERLKLLLNQQDPATLGRMMRYYGYLNGYRRENIQTVAARIRELAELRRRVAGEEAELERIAALRQTELAELDTAQDRRRKLLAAVTQRIESEGREIERLAAQERDLKRLVAELASILSDYPITSEDPFAAHKGRLTWPVAGSLLHDFGQPRAGGQLTWNGVVLAAPRGREVRAVYHGRVAFSDWLAGLGLLVIVDHGDGYMSLYGYNETLVKNTGDWVAPGDVIATVGDSGGQQQAGLYFEIRQNTRPVNPRQWVTRTPGG